MATLKSLKNKYLTASDGTILGVTTNTENVSLLAFKVATADSLSKFNLVDGASDDYQDATGIDTGNSSGEIRSSNNYFSGAVAGNYFGDGSLGDCVFGSSSITQTNDTVAIDTKLSTGSESGGPGTNSYGYGAQGCYYPNNPPCPDTVYYTPNSTATYEITVPNTNGSYDGDMTYAQFNTLTINSGVTLTTKQPGRGLFIYVKGNCVINGSLCMTARGGASNPTVSGGSDSNAVSASGIQLGMVKSGGTDTFTNDGTGFNGAGTGIRSIVANQMDIASNGTIFTIARVGANGGGNRSGSTAQSGQSGTAGTSAVTILTGGGGGGAISKAGGAGHGTAISGTGGKGGCFSGGPGGGSACINWDTSGTAGNAVDYGGAAGASVSAGSAQYNNAGGSAGAPRSHWAGGTNSHTREHGADGSGGLLWLVVGGNLTIASGATIEAKGGAGGDATSHASTAGGASSAGGAIMILYYGTLSNSGSISVAGGSAGSAQATGGPGAAGGSYTSSVDVAEAYANMTLQSNAFTASTPSPGPTTIRLMMDEYTSTGSATLDTDIKGYVSRNGGTNWEQTALTSQATIDTNHRYLSGSADVSGQPAGTSVKYKIETLNQSTSKVTRIYGTSMAWA